MLTILAATLLLAASASVRTLDIATFTVPAGFEFTESPDHVNFRRVDSTNWLQFGIYKGRDVSHDLSTEFTFDWNDLFRATGVAAPTSIARTLGSGIEAREGGTLVASIGFVQLVDVDAGDKVVSIIIKTGNAEGMTTYRETIEQVLASVLVRRAPKNAPAASAAAPAALPGAAPLGKAERVPDSSFKNGSPQGIFTGISLLSGKAICLLFLDGGRITRSIPEGGLQEFHWEQHKKDHSGDCGTYTVSDGTLSVRWGDGGVHTGPLKGTPNGIEFYGKRYTRPETVSVEKLAGSWQSARTAFDLTVTHELEIGADGSFHWVSGTGGVVAGRAVARENRNLRGKLTIRGLTATFKGDDGSVQNYTFLPVPGEPVGAFAIGRDMFVRK